MTTPNTSDFRFINYKLKALSFTHYDIAHRENANYTFELKFKSKHQHINITDHSPASDITAETTRTLIDLDLAIIWKDVSPFDCTLSIRGEFAHTGKMTAEVYQNYVEIHAPSILLAHARPIINSIMREAQQPFILPLYNISEAIRAERAQRPSPGSAPAAPTTPE